MARVERSERRATAESLGWSRPSALSRFIFGVATVARPWEFRTLASAATLILRLDSALGRRYEEFAATRFVTLFLLSSSSFRCTQLNVGARDQPVLFSGAGLNDDR